MRAEERERARLEAAARAKAEAERRAAAAAEAARLAAEAAARVEDERVPVGSCYCCTPTTVCSNMNPPVQLGQLPRTPSCAHFFLTSRGFDEG